MLVSFHSFCQVFTKSFLSIASCWFLLSSLKAWVLLLEQDRWCSLASHHFTPDWGVLMLGQRWQGAGDGVLADVNSHLLFRGSVAWENRKREPKSSAMPGGELCFCLVSQMFFPEICGHGVLVLCPDLCLANNSHPKFPVVVSTLHPLTIAHQIRKEHFLSLRLVSCVLPTWRILCFPDGLFARAATPATRENPY